MKDNALLVALKTSQIPVDEALLHDVTHFLKAIDRAAKTPLEEAVPADMMQMFTDEQWLDLLFEFQPGATLYSSCYDVATLHQGWMESGEVSAQQPAEEQHNWVIFSDKEGLLVKMLNPDEFHGFCVAADGKTFSEIAAAIWPELQTEESHKKLTEMVLAWLDDELVIDAGVPLPDDAEFEDAD